MPTRRSGCAVSLPILIIIFVAATLLAAGIFLGIPYLQNRPDFPRGTFPIFVEGNQILVEMDPDREVMIFGGGAGPGTGGQVVGQLVTSTPVVLPTTGPTLPPPPTATIPLAPTFTPRPASTGCVIFTDYAVQAGDTLFSISNKFVTSIPLMARHGISSTSLSPGAVIRVPVGDPSCCTGGWRPYVVSEGETWFSIANKCGVTVDTLQSGNGVGAGAMLYMASVICVP